MQLAFTILLISACRPATLSVLLQYDVIRFGWRTSRSAALISYVAVANIFIFLVLFPRFITQLSQRQVRHQAIDYKMVQVSLIFLSFGAVFIGPSPSIATLLPCKRFIPHLVEYKC